MTMEAATQSLPPSSTTELIERLACAVEEREVQALRALSRRMISIFADEPRLSFASEAAQLSGVTANDDSAALINAFINAVIKGTADGTVLDPEILRSFSYVLWHTKGFLSSPSSLLGSALQSLQKRLKKAMRHAEPEHQYQLLRTLSDVLDAMVEIKASGLSREALHEPLLKLLGDLSRSPELRLAQAAGYAYQALRCIPNDEGPYHALLRRVGKIGAGAAKTAGAVSTMDPSKMLDAIPDLMELPEVTKSMLEVIQSLSEARSSLRGIRSPRKQKAWYTALRYVDMLLEAKAFEKLKDFVLKVDCRTDEDFLCGLFVRLEVAWSHDSLIKKNIVELFRWFLERLDLSHQRAQEWVKIVASTLCVSESLSDLLLRQPHSFRLKKRTYTSRIDIFLGIDLQFGKSTKLFMNGWLACQEAQLYYADARIKEYYTQGQHLQIERLSGELLPMDQCYINLALTNKSSEIDQTFNISLDETEKGGHVLLPKLFDARKAVDNSTLLPRRILIRGQAGVGKTTLCKKIVHECIKGAMWAEKFDRVLWIPLRRLKGRSETFNIITLLYQEFFSRRAQDRGFAEALWNEVSLPEPKNRTLFLLDGLDEVSPEWNRGTGMYELLQSLLKQPYVIFTSRPHGMDLQNYCVPDLEIETIGFLPHQVQSYVKQVVDSTEKAEKLLSFLKDRVVIAELARIPIQLDALCYSWNGGGFVFQSEPETMTTLYRAVTSELWRKDILRLGKQHQGNSISEHDAKLMKSPSQIENLVKEEIGLLGYLAFTGLTNSVVEFTPEYRHLVYEHMEIDLGESTLERLSFLRTSGEEGDGNRSYHFLHLTLQEFFAASYFVKKWLQEEQIDCFELVYLDQTRTAVSHSAKHILRMMKYRAQYDMFLRFCTGLVQDHDLKTPQSKKLMDFFSELDSESPDLLGSMHQRLLMRCSSEIASRYQPRRHGLQDRLDSQLSQWIQSECQVFGGISYLGWEIACPERVLLDLLCNGSTTVQIEISEALKNRPNISRNAVQTASDLLKNGASAYTRSSALKVLASHSPSLSQDDAIQAAKLLEDPNIDVRRFATTALRSQFSLPERIIQALLERLEDLDLEVRFRAFVALGAQDSLSDDLRKHLIKFLKGLVPDPSILDSWPIYSWLVYATRFQKLRLAVNHSLPRELADIFDEELFKSPSIQASITKVGNLVVDFLRVSLELRESLSFDSPTVKPASSPSESQAAYELLMPYVERKHQEILTKASKSLPKIAKEARDYLSSPRTPDILGIAEWRRPEGTSSKNFLKLEPAHLAELFQVWIRLGFYGAIGCRIIDDSFIIERNGVREMVPLYEKAEEEKLRSCIREAQIKLGVPANELRNVLSPA